MCRKSSKFDGTHRRVVEVYLSHANNTRVPGVFHHLDTELRVARNAVYRSAMGNAMYTMHALISAVAHTMSVSSHHIWHAVGVDNKLHLPPLSVVSHRCRTATDVDFLYHQHHHSSLQRHG